MNRSVQPSLFVGQDECGHVGSGYCCVYDQDEDQPVPGCLEGRVMQHSPGVDSRRLHFVLWQHVQSKRQHLHTLNASFFHYPPKKNLPKISVDLD